MVVNDDAGSLTPRGVAKSIVSMLAPTQGLRYCRATCVSCSRIVCT